MQNHQQRIRERNEGYRLERGAPIPFRTRVMALADSFQAKEYEGARTSPPLAAAKRKKCGCSNSDAMLRLCSKPAAIAVEASKNAANLLDTESYLG